MLDVRVNYINESEFDDGILRSRLISRTQFDNEKEGDVIYYRSDDEEKFLLKKKIQINEYQYDYIVRKMK